MSRTPKAALRAKVYGFWVSQCLYVAARLGIADRLGDEGCTAMDAASGSGVPAHAMERLLRALASIGILQAGDGRYHLTAEGALLRSDVADNLRPELLHMLHPSSWSSWAGLLESVTTGEPAFARIHDESPWQYRASHPEAADAFYRMAAAKASSQRDAILQALDVPPSSLVVDVGGGQGDFLAALLLRHQAARGVLLDTAAVLVAAEAVLRASGVADRCRVASGDFFESVPAGGDLYLLKSILHNWDDDAAVRILATCRHAMRPGARLVAIERVLDPNHPTLEDLMDLHMLVMHGGRERSRQEYERLYAAAGLRLLRVDPVRPEPDLRLDLICGVVASQAP